VIGCSWNPAGAAVSRIPSFWAAVAGLRDCGDFSELMVTA
jgi:hypothetical protein